MASVKEYFESREGNTLGISSIDFNRVFTVELDNVEDDPLSLTKSEVPIGSAYPGYANIRAATYSVERRLSAILWRVRVTYVPSSQFENLRWKLRVDSGTEQTTINETVERVENETEERKIIGPVAYKSALETDQWTHWTYYTTEDSQGVIQTIRKFLVKTKQRTIVGQQVDLPTLTLTLSRNQLVDPFPRIPSIGAYLKKINRSPLVVYSFEQGFTINAGQCKFDAFSIEESSAPINGDLNSDTGSSYKVALSFLISSIPFSPIKKIHTYKHENTDQESYIYLRNAGPAGEETPVVEDFPIIRGVDFNSLLINFD